MAENGAIEQTTHYYPFGNSFADAGTSSSLQHYKYNGKELDRMHGLDWYDYGARNYDPVILQWDRPDPLADKYYPVSPYVYCMDNPVRFIDYKGFAPGDPYPTPDEAARNFGLIYNYWSIKNNVEMASLIYSFTDEDGKVYYSYNTPKWGGKTFSVPSTQLPKNASVYGLIHTHAAYDGNTEDPHDGNDFSDKDIDSYKKCNFDGAYVCTTNGTLMKYHKKDKKTYEVLIFKGQKYRLPSDSSDPSNNGNTITKIDAEWEAKPWYETFLHSINDYLEQR
ncbi:MAG: DUF4329 domain-containing protein [Prevotella sp.]|nr:DUF4329 domain-containing protein [Prevotella sp.]